MYDKFTPFKKIPKGLNFNFTPERYELWQAPGCIENFTNIIFEVKQDDSTGKIMVKCSPNNLNLPTNLEFDLCYTSGDRIYCATVPNETNINQSNAFRSFKMNVPMGFNIITREFKNFSVDEPYVLSIFLINQHIAKISFSFENNPRLLEFYAKGVRE